MKTIPPGKLPLNSNAGPRPGTPGPDGSADDSSKDASGKWTEDQIEAIRDRGRDLLVSAAAGSGKTAVLTERVLRLISEPTAYAGEPIPLEELLVITFTRKAAREMRERIEQKIMQRLDKDQNNSYLRAALDALPRSNILTLDAFCDRLVRRHFHLARVSPNVQLADENEATEIEQTATRQVFEELSRTGEDDESTADKSRLVEASREFAYLIAATSSGFGHGGVLGTLAARVHRVRTFIASLEDPKSWKTKVHSSFHATLDARSIDTLPEQEMIGRVFAQSFADVAGTFEHLCEHAMAKVGSDCLPDEWNRIRNEFGELRTWLETAQHPLTQRLQTIEEWFAQNADKLEKMQNKGVCGPALHAAKDFLNHVVEKFSSKMAKWRHQWFCIDLKHQLAAAQLAAKQGLALLNLVDRIEERVQEIKLRRGVIGFQDVERKALEVLTGESGQDSEIARQYQDFFKHVLVDEYQDISPLQDAIIRRLSHSHATTPNVERNLFIVGDLKQSIYRFRRAEPRLFARRLDLFGESGTDNWNRRIDLKTNFRSRPGILAAVNAVFERLMDRAIGDIEYDERAKLYPHRVDPDDAGPVSVEAHWIIQDAPDADEDVEIDEEQSETEDSCGGIEREAQWIAHRIQQLTDEESGLLISDPESNVLRRARPGDCAVLVRRLNMDIECWLSTLSRRGINIRVCGRAQLLIQPEIFDLLNALRLSENPFQDIPLAAVLRSPMVGLDESELLRVRMVRRSGAFHRAVWSAVGRENVFLEEDERGMGHSSEPNSDLRLDVLTEPLRRKLNAFFAKLDRWRFLAEQTEAEAVLDAILSDSNYEAHMSGLPDGAGRLKNVEELRRMMRARAGRVIGTSSLGDFLRSISEMEDAPDTGEELEELEDNQNYVRLLTVHKSKGLEFPIVFLPRLASRFGGSISRDELEMDVENGMALGAVDPERRLQLRPLALTAMREDEARQARAEELRLLYVAMTRARDRLVLLGTSASWKSPDRLQEKWNSSPIARDGPIPAWLRLKAQSSADLLGPIFNKLKDGGAAPWLSVAYPNSLPPPPRRIELPLIREALASGGESEELWQQARMQFVETFSGDARAAEICRALQNGQEKTLNNADYAPKLLFLSSRIGGLSRVPLKLYASELRRDALTGKLVWERCQGDVEDQERSKDPNSSPSEMLTPPRGLASKVPAFVTGDATLELDAATKGTLTHALLRHVDLGGPLDEEGLRSQAHRIWERGLLDLEKVELLDQLRFNDLARFFKSRLGQGMISRTGSVARELPFRRWIRPCEVHERQPDGSLLPLAPANCTERIMIQGVIDCVIDFGNEAVIVDYKTDAVRNPSDVARLKERYSVQVDTYRQALRTIWRIPVAESYLAFLHAGQNVLVEDLHEGL